MRCGLLALCVALSSGAASHDVQGCQPSVAADGVSVASGAGATSCDDEASFVQTNAVNVLHMERYIDKKEGQGRDGVGRGPKAMLERRVALARDFDLLTRWAGDSTNTAVVGDPLGESVATVANEVFQEVDADRDGVLEIDEFQKAFLGPITHSDGARDDHLEGFPAPPVLGTEHFSGMPFAEKSRASIAPTAGLEAGFGFPATPVLGTESLYGLPFTEKSRASVAPTAGLEAGSGFPAPPVLGTESFSGMPFAEKSGSSVAPTAGLEVSTTTPPSAAAAFFRPKVADIQMPQPVGIGDYMFFMIPDCKKKGGIVGKLVEAIVISFTGNCTAMAVQIILIVLLCSCCCLGTALCGHCVRKRS